MNAFSNNPTQGWSAHEVALHHRADRAWLEITGKDRQSWTHNLTTNAVKTLRPGEGNYAFALNVQGRILFDLNILVAADRLYFDLDRSFLAFAVKHLNKYIITEDVQVADRSEEYDRFALIGDRAGDVLAPFGASNARAWPLLGLSSIALPNLAGAESRAMNSESPTSVIHAFRSDFCGLFCVDLVVPRAQVDALRRALLVPDRSPRVTEFGDEFVQTFRIEAGIPWSGREISDEYLPAETRQFARAVSYQKGCYLGQEVVERMRSRQVVARQLVLLKLGGANLPPKGAGVIGADEKPIGSVTSACHSPTHGCPIALAYVKTAFAASGTAVKIVAADLRTDGQVIDLPSASAH